MSAPTMSQFATELDCLRARDKFFQQENADLRAQLAAAQGGVIAEIRHPHEDMVECANYWKARATQAEKRIEEAEKQGPVAEVVSFYDGCIQHKRIDPLVCISQVRIGKLYTRPIPPADVAELQDKLDKSTSLIQEIAGIAFEHIQPNETTLGLPHLLRSQFGRVAELERKLDEQNDKNYFEATRLRALASKCGIAVPDSDEELLGVAGTILGSIRRVVDGLYKAREEGRKEAVPPELQHEPMRADESMTEQLRAWAYINGWNACRNAMLAAAPSPALNAKEGGE